MISRSGKKNFLVAHYDWLVLAFGIVVLAAGVALYVMSLGANPDEAAAVEADRVAKMKPADIGVKPVDMTELQNASRLTKNPLVVAELSETAENFLSSERRVLCKCGKAISGDVRAFPKCPYCGEKQEEEKKIVLDADQDGLSDEWERKYGFNPNDPSDATGDADGDEFTNLEEYEAKTNPKDKNDHPDYLDSVKIALPLKETYMPFILTGATPIPAGWRCKFFAPGLKDQSGYGRQGARMTAVVGEEVPGTGFVVKSYEKKETKKPIKGASGLMKTVDVSEVVVERKNDGKVMKLVRAMNEKESPMPVDVQATLIYERGTAKNFDVVPGSEIVLSGVKYRIVDIKAVGKGAKVTVENSISSKKRVLEALEP